MDRLSHNSVLPSPASVRRTVQGEIIRTVFEDAQRPLSPREAHELARQVQPRVGIATVYRAINRFIEEGFVTPVEIPGVGTHYEAVGGPHHHYFHCGGCGRVYVIPGCPGQISALLPSGFRMERHDIVLHGRCRDCAG